ncbi:DUF3631 domain-containing protein [Bradyrhizobium diazoefficiens]|uniref:DUF3631 domain-containing protein n=1 Tax=Bradyrhizobium diazoefficiens TaxID=1355477 RepID=UPI0015B46155|nr:DUF3631 domain-containing protein [Bradyrhizobium diazoefficiens]QLD40510.1 DUF3631 domain-containing protein [Bradyrhizobium diazoefficiens]
MPRSLQRLFDLHARARLRKLFAALGTDNAHESATARERIDALLREHGRHWSDVIELLGGDVDVLLDDLVRDIAGLGAADPAARARARRAIDDLLVRERKTWNDLVAALSGSHEAWACKPQQPDPDRVNPLALILHLLGDYVALAPHQLVAVSLWALHTFVYAQFAVTPRLVLRSPTAGAGKTVLLDLLSTLVPKPEKFDAITTAALIRTIDQMHPTVLIDEADNMNIALQPNGRLRAIFNSGHRQGGTDAISERGTVRKFSTFAPLALALPEMVHGLPRTLNSRSITIGMERSPRQLKRYDPVAPNPALTAAYLQAYLWAHDPALELNRDPEMPVMGNRFADNWRPLIAIADALGYGEEARDAMMIFAREFRDADVKIILLADIRRIFDAQGGDRLPSAVLLAALHGLDDAEWQEFQGARGEQQPHKLRAGELAGMLRDFGIKSRTIWPHDRTAESKSSKGYLAVQFEDAWRRYCGDAGGGTAAQSNVVKITRAAS